VDRLRTYRPHYFVDQRTLPGKDVLFPSGYDAIPNKIGIGTMSACPQQSAQLTRQALVFA